LRRARPRAVVLLIDLLDARCGRVSLERPVWGATRRLDGGRPARRLCFGVAAVGWPTAAPVGVESSTASGMRPTSDLELGSQRRQHLLSERGRPTQTVRLTTAGDAIRRRRDEPADDDVDGGDDVFWRPECWPGRPRTHLAVGSARESSQRGKGDGGRGREWNPASFWPKVARR
jgi:hypothetical protein